MKKYFDSYAISLPKAWGASFGLFLLAALVLGGLFGALTLAFPSLDIKEPPFDMLLYVLQFSLAFAYIYFDARQGYRFRERSGQAQPGWGKAQFGRIPLPLLILLIAVLPFSLAVITEPLTSWIPMPESLRSLFESMLSNNWSTIITVVVLAALLEEWLLRGVVLKGLLLKGYSPAKAIIWSAVIFGAIHLNPWQAVTGFTLGCLFGWIYWRTRCLWLTIFLHALNNGTSCFMSYLYPDIDMETSSADLWGWGTYGIIVLVAITLCALILPYLHKNLAPGFQPGTPKADSPWDEYAAGNSPSPLSES